MMQTTTTTTTTTFSSMTDVTNMLADALNGVEENFDIDAFASQITVWENGRLIIRPEYTDTDTDEGTAAFWTLVEQYDEAALRTAR